MTTQSTAGKQKSVPVLVLFGMDEGEKPRAATFDETQAEAALKLATSMDLKVLKIENLDQAVIARQLPVGRLYMGGKGMVPYIRQDLYAKIAKLSGATQPSEVHVQGAATSGSASDLAPAAQAGVENEATAAETASTGGAETSGRESATPAPQTPIKGLPSSWSDIEVGHLVIAQESVEDGWWEAIVLEREQDLFTLRWRDFPKFPKFVRHRLSIALACPTLR